MREPISVKRYAGSRFYDTAHARYVTLDDLREWRERGIAFTVHDARRGRTCLAPCWPLIQGRVDSRDHARKQNPWAVDPVLRDDPDDAPRGLLPHLLAGGHMPKVDGHSRRIVGMTAQFNDRHSQKGYMLVEQSGPISIGHRSLLGNVLFGL